MPEDHCNRRSGLQETSRHNRDGTQQGGDRRSIGIINHLQRM
jgi:hypothetical protein